MTQTPKREMIAKIYEIVSDKTLSFGCKVKVEGLREDVEWRVEHIFSNGCVRIDNYTLEPLQGYDISTVKAIGHPVMLGDVLDWVEKNNPYLFMGNSPLYIYEKCFAGINQWLDKCKPIEEQSEKCITYIYTLIQESHG